MTELVCEYLTPEECCALGLVSKEMWSKVLDDTSHVGRAKVMARKGVVFCVRHGNLYAALKAVETEPDFNADRVLLALVAMSPKTIDWNDFLSLVDKCIQKGVTDSVATSALNISVSFRNVVLMQELLRAGASCTATALSRAIDETFFEGVQFLIECGVAVTQSMVEDALAFSSEQVLEFVLIAWDKAGHSRFPGSFLVGAVLKESIPVVTMVLGFYMASGATMVMHRRARTGVSFAFGECAAAALDKGPPTSAMKDCLAHILHLCPEVDPKRAPWEDSSRGDSYGEAVHRLVRSARRRRQKLFGPTH